MKNNLSNIFCGLKKNPPTPPVALVAKDVVQIALEREAAAWLAYRHGLKVAELGESVRYIPYGEYQIGIAITIPGHAFILCPNRVFWMVAGWHTTHDLHSPATRDHWLIYAAAEDGADLGALIASCDTLRQALAMVVSDEPVGA